MGDDPYTTQREASRSASSRNSTSQSHAAYASQRAEVLFACYRRGDANDPERYVAAIAAVLSLYDRDLIREVTDPRTGICTTEKHMTFMPNAGELKVYCEAQAARRERLKHLGSLPARPRAQALPAPEPRPGDLANLFIDAGNIRYESLVEWAKTADARLWRFDAERPGIWVAHNVWDERHTIARRLGAAAQDVAADLTLSPQARKVVADRDTDRARAQEAAE